MPTPLYVLAGQSNALALSGRNGGTTPLAVYAGLTGSTDVQLATVAADGAPLTFGRSDADWYSKGELAAQLVDTVLAHLAQGAELAAILWVQGEADGWECSRSAEYGQRLVALLDQVEATLALHGVAPGSFRFTVLALSAQCPGATDRLHWQEIRAQQLALADPRIDVIDPDALSVPGDLFQSDGLHYAAGANAAVLTAMMDRGGLDLVGTPGDDQLAGLSGADTLHGGHGSDLLEGRDGNDTLGGWQGDDTLAGGAGDDRISSGAGRDQVWGGAGADTFAFYAAEGFGGRDRIMDFAPGQDVIDLSLIDADATRAGNQAFHWLGATGSDGRAGALWVSGGANGLVLSADATGDGKADMTLLLWGQDNLSLSDLLL